LSSAERKLAEKRLVAEYLERAVHFTRLAAEETDLIFGLPESRVPAAIRSCLHPRRRRSVLLR
jgi:hypothetical protein